jgi:hypothetical protein
MSKIEQGRYVHRIAFQFKRKIRCLRKKNQTGVKTSFAEVEIAA